MMKETRNNFVKLGLALAFALFACAFVSAQDVTSNAMPGADFSKYHTYKWVPIEGASYPNQIVDAQIKASIDSQLASKGLTKTDGDKADLLIGYQVSIQQEKQWNAYGTGGMRWGGGMASAQQSTISIGTLVADMYDPANKQLVWRGAVSKTLNISKDPDKNYSKLEKALAKLFRNYPPGMGKQ